MTPIWKKDGGGWQLLAPIGFPDESSLQSLVEKAPHVLPLAGSPRMVIVGREVMLGNGYADLIAIEPTGRLAILEVKLARNSEARRAVVAQVLTYAAYLNGLDPIVVERDVLAGHLKQRGYETLPSAVESNDQEGSFDLGDFAKGLSDCLAQGRFRIVLVLDDAPEELVRLVGYLGAVTEGRLLIDLITVSIYRIGDSEVIVPQRVESERRPVEVPDKTNRTITAACTVEGVEDFDASIASLPAQQQAPLKRLRDWAVSLTKGGLIKLQTTHSKTPNFLAPAHPTGGRELGLGHHL